MASSRRRRTGGACIWGRRVGFRRERAIILLLIGCACFSLPTQGVPGDPGSSNLRSPSGQESAAEKCTTANGGTSCSCGAVAGGVAGRAVKQLQATLSEDSPKLDLTCTGSFTAVPDTIKDGDVCSKEADVSICSKSAQDANTAVKLNTLLGTATAVKWVGASDGQQKYALDVPKGAFPLVDKDFSVGCKDSNAAGCKVSVGVQARKSTTVGQAVTCAYGSASNDKRQSVTLTPSNNTLTITCGEGGKMVPDDYLTKFCAYGEDPGSCTSQAFTGLLPAFDQSWWVTKDNQAVLTIPANKFPADEQKFTLGCKYTPPTSKPDNTRDAQSSASPSVCSVDVIVAKQSPTTTTTSSTSSAFSSVCVSRTSVNVVVGLLSLGALQAVSLLV